MRIVLSFHQMESEVQIKVNRTNISEVCNNCEVNMVVQTLEMYLLCFGILYCFLRPFC